MRFKSKDIAKALGVSPATVSLALNDRPGVNEETRKRILDYIDEMEKQHSNSWQAVVSKPKQGMVLLINYMKHGVIMERNQEPDNSFIKRIGNIVTMAGYQFWHTVFHEKPDSLEDLLEECRNRQVQGIYIMAAEMQKGDIYPFLQLGIPVVTGDNLFDEEGVDSYLIDNMEGIRRGVDYLIDKGHSNIVYLAESIDIFNFTQRRRSFIDEMERRDCGDVSKWIVHLGNTVDEVYESMNRYLDEGFRKVTAFMLESSVISLGVSKALMERQIRIPCDISLLGFDALPPVSLPGIDLTLIKGTHTKRHIAAVEHLIRRIEDEDEEIVWVYYKTRLLEGQSVFDKTKYIYKSE